MLLPSAASNPASIIAQAITMYKSLLGNVPSESSQETSSAGLLKGEDPSGEPADGGSTTTARIPDTGRSVDPSFSLQSTKKRQ